MDRLYLRITGALEGHLDPAVFEACAADLLRDAFPGLVPIRGGDDAGMDGAIPDGDGESFPLICTTSADVIGNLTDNLDSILRSGRRSRKAVLATSQPLTARRRRNLEDRAREMGFTLVQIVDREGIAQRLRWSSKWCRELGIAWAPSALAMVPKTRRPFLEIESVGREADLEWLRATGGDRLVSGQPGSGKTFLLYQLTKEGWGLFLVDDERRAIAGALAEEKPRVVIVDDAHASPSVLEMLRHLRTETGVSFDIVATTWDGERDRVAEAMGGLSPDQMHRLELLTREEILEVYRRAGIEGPEPMLAHLVDQAANKPGLAVTLATIVLRGGKEALAAIFKGEFLHRNVTAVFRDLVGEQAENILASFALGGDRGMAMTAVAEFLGMSLGDLRTKVVGLAAGGVLTETGEQSLAVWPRTLRPSLLRSVFFGGSGTVLDYRPLLALALAPASAVEALVTAAAYGARIPPADLRTLVVQGGSREAWRVLVHVDQSWARWVVENYPGRVEDIAREALVHVPEAVIPRLLTAAVGATGELHSCTDHPLRLVSDWIQGTADADEGIRRRQLAVRLGKRYLESGGDRLVGLRVLFLALSPKWETIRADALGRASVIRWGLLSAGALERMAGVWAEARAAVREIDAASWPYLKDALWTWVYPRYAARSNEVPAATCDSMRNFAATVLRDLRPLAADSPGLSAGLKDLGGRIRVDLELSEDPDFARLYPSREEELERRRAGLGEPDEELRTIAQNWAELPPAETARKLARFEQAATWIGRTWPRRASGFCRLLAGQVLEPESWLVSFLEQGLPVDLSASFLEAVVERRRPSWQQAVAGYLEDRRIAAAAASCVLRMSEAPPELRHRAIDVVGEFPQLVETLGLGREVPTETLRALLAHESPEAALAAALGEWASDPFGEVREEVSGPWRGAILRSATGDEKATAVSEHWLAQILGKDPELALEWTLARMGREEVPRGLDNEEALSSVVSALSVAQRRRVLEALTPGLLSTELIPRLVDRDPGLFQTLFRLDHLRDYQLSALRGKPDERWAELAQVALDEGRNPEEVAGAAFLGGHSFWGHGGDYWNEWQQAFHMLENDPRPGIREVARFGKEIALARVHESQARERHDQVFGR